MSDSTPHQASRQQKQHQRRSNSKKKKDATKDLVNFRFAPPERRSSTGATRKKKKAKQLKRYTPPQAFPLFASSMHSFEMKSGFRHNKDGSIIPSWDDVVLVKSFTALLEEPTCPICLDTFQAPRITKCGHVFCLPCLLRHVYSIQSSGSGKSTTCPCCSLPTYNGDWKLVEFASVQPPLPNTRVKMVKLHKAPQNNIPYRPSAVKAEKTLKYNPFQRYNAANSSKCSQERQSNLDQLHRYKSTLSEYDAVEAAFVDMAIQFIESNGLFTVTVGDLESASFQDESGISQGQEAEEDDEWPELTSNAEDTKVSVQHRLQQETHNKTPHKHVDKEESMAAAVGQRQQQDAKKGSPETKGSSGMKNKEISKQASVFLPEGETQFYQSADGQVCFLSALNMKCLQAEFATHESDSAVFEKRLTEPGGEQDSMRDSPKQTKEKAKKPLPDVIEATVLHVEHVQMTSNNMRPFLSHLPLYIDVMFVELDLNHLLSARVKKQFQSQLNRRKQERQAAKRAEKRMDRLTIKKEKEAVKERKARLQYIEPGDEFFRPAPEPTLSTEGDDFGPALSTSPTHTSIGANTAQAAAFRFSEVCATNGVWPELNNSATAVSSSPQSHRPGNNAWGGRQLPATSNPVEPSFSALGSSPPDATKGKKKKRKDKIVLFSTGGGRGY